MIARTPIVDDDGSGTTGTIINNAWKQELYNQIDTLAGQWYPIVFDAANFYASAGATWSVTAAQVQSNRAVLAGNTLFWHMKIAAAPLSADAAGLSLVIPYGLTAAGDSVGLMKLYDSAGLWSYGDLLTSAGSNVIQVGKMDYSNWRAGPIYLYFKTWIDLNLPPG